MVLNKKAQLDFEDINIAGIVFAIIALGIGIIVAKSMGAGVIWRVVVGLICAIVAYIVGSKIAEG